VWHLLLREASLRAKGSFVANKPTKVHAPLKTPNLGKVLTRSKRLRAMKIRI